MVPVTPGRHRRFETEPPSTADFYQEPTAMAYPESGAPGMWQPDPAARSLSSPGDSMAARFLYLLIAPSFLRWFRWGQILAGWFFATMGIAGLTKLIRRD